MTLADIDLYRYEVQLAAPLQLGGTTVTSRCGLLVRLRSETGAVGWGEAAPLPRFSGESLDEVTSYATASVEEWTGRRLRDLDEQPLQILGAFPLGADCPASLRFAVESALIDVIASSRNTGLASVLDTPREIVRLNALIGNLGDIDGEQLNEILQAGYRAVKVKVGRRSVASEASEIRSVAKTLDGRASLRLDANRAWDLDEAIQFVEALPSTGVEYLEEPLSTPGALGTLSSRIQCPLALDETTREREPSDLSRFSGVTAVVLKPTLLGGVRKTLAWMNAAEENGVTPVISSAYETGVGLRMLVALASIGPDTPVGLSTYNRLSHDVLRSRLLLEGSSVDVAVVADPPIQVDSSFLHRISAST